MHVFLNEITSGVKQGSISSALLFITYMEEIINRVKHHQESPVMTLAQADDICSYDLCGQSLPGAAEAWQRTLNEAELKINEIKSEVRVYGREQEL